MFPPAVAREINALAVAREINALAPLRFARASFFIYS